MRSHKIYCLCAIGVVLAGCNSNPIQPADQHLMRPVVQPVASSGIPEMATRSVILPPPKPVTKVETYSVVVTNVPAQEILFALARDAKINVDIHPGIEGTVTVNAINQTLPQILTRIARQVEMRYEINNGYLTVMPDSPYLHNYKIDYVNMTRDSEGEISDSTQIGSGTSGGTTSNTGNSSTVSIKNTSKNHFWETLTQNIKDILRETDKIIPADSDKTLLESSGEILESSSEALLRQIDEVASSLSKASDNNKNTASKDGAESSAKLTKGAKQNTRRSTFREAASVIANPENGIITVRATGKQHVKIQEFIDQIMTSARRQVLIEATIVEVRLNSNYQQGIDWRRFRLGSKGFNISQEATAALPTASSGSMFTLGYLNPTSKFGDLAANISLLESFGNVKVLSSPKLSVMNNQTAILRVVDNLVYFTIKADTVANQTTTTTTFTTTPNTVPIGFTMSVTPQINDSDTVLLNMRPSISRLLGYVNDPNPELKVANVISRIPQTQTREIESVLKIENNQTAVLGGLMEDRIDKKTDEVLGLASIPLIGNLFKNRNDETTKTELVIFLRPTVIKDADINGDFSAFRANMPDQDFFNESARGK